MDTGKFESNDGYVILSWVGIKTKPGMFDLENFKDKTIRHWKMKVIDKPVSLNWLLHDECMIILHCFITLEVVMFWYLYICKLPRYISFLCTSNKYHAT